MYEYSSHLDELFYLTTDNYSNLTTKLIKVIDNKIILNYKCKENGYIKIKLTDKFNNAMKIDNTDLTYETFDTLTNNDYEITTLSWNNITNISEDYVKIHIEMYNSNIYSMSGEIYEPSKNFTHLVYKVHDYQERWFLENKSDNFSSINLFNKYNMKVKSIEGNIKYDEKHTKAFINLKLENNRESKYYYMIQKKM